MSWISDYIRIPYVDGGRDHTGCDCWGLVRLVLFEMCGIEINDYGGVAASDVVSVNHKVSKDKAIKPWQFIVNKGEEKIYDVVVLNGVLGRSVVPIHVGIVTKEGWILHTNSKQDCTQEKLDSPSIKRRIVSIHRHEILACQKISQ